MHLLDIKDAPEKSKRIFAQLSDAIEEQNINPTPLNYFIWYEYLKGNLPKFRQEMDSILNDPFGYNDRVGRRLYEEFFAHEEDDTEDDFDRAFRRLIGAVIKKMNLWSTKLEQHTQNLDACASSLSDPNLDASELKKLTHSVLSTATSMQKSSAEFQQEMMESTAEVQHLREQLIQAKSELMTDELTQIGNRKAFNNAIQELTAEYIQTPETVCLIMTDIDHFKRFNDTFGHLVGDSVLRYFANTMKKSKGENETVCRYGGEEFAILLHHSSEEAARNRAEKVRQAIASANLKRKDSDKSLGTITASFGVAAYQGETQTIDEFIKSADDALYYAKEHGRNQVVTISDISEAETPH